MRDAQGPADKQHSRDSSAGGAFIGRLDDAFGYEALSLAEQSAGIGVWSIDLGTGLVRATPQFFRTMGLEPTSDRVPIAAIRALRHPDDRDRVVDGFKHALDGGIDSYEIEYRIIRPDGQVRWIFGRGRVVRGADGKPERYNGIDLDITERKAAEAALAAAKVELERMNQALEDRVRERTLALEAEAKRRADTEIRLHQAQKMEAVGQLTGGIAHDFNNILQVIMGNLEIARVVLQQSPRDASAKAPDAAIKAIDTAQRASRSAGQLVQRMLVFSRMQRLEPASLDVNALITDMQDMIARTLGATIEVKVSLTPGLWPIFADRNQLESALLNLVVNARDAMPDGGTLTIETANIALAATSGDDVAPGQYTMINVSDTGCGIPKELMDKVFEPFFTTKEVGTGSGLGLSMVYGFVKQSRGHVRLDSEIGAGTSVKIHLPRSTASDTPDSVAASRLDTPFAESVRAREGETVLLVEDNEQVRTLGVSALENLGYRVLAAPDGREALRLLDGHASPRVDLLFTDVVLPGGMSGPELAKAASAQRPGLSVLFTSGYTRKTAGNDDALHANARMLRKPYALDTLATAVRRAIDGGGGADGAA